MFDDLDDLLEDVLQPGAGSKKQTLSSGRGNDLGPKMTALGSKATKASAGADDEFDWDKPATSSQPVKRTGSAFGVSSGPLKQNDSIQTFGASKKDDWGNNNDWDDVTDSKKQV
jgi:hypothetical protein